MSYRSFFPVLSSYSMTIQLFQKFSRSSIPDVNTSIKTTCDQDNIIRMPNHTNHSSIVLQFLTNTVGSDIINNHLRVHACWSYPVIFCVKRDSMDKSKQYSLNEDDGERDHTLQQSSFLLHFHWYENRKQQSMNQLPTIN